jgi:poly(3-hydroxybutyrate) depolymerase
VYNSHDGLVNRCFISVFPSNPELTATSYPLPVLIFFHGSGGHARNCDTGPDDAEGNNWGDIANLYGFIFICAEAQKFWMTNAQGQQFLGGNWDIPFEQTAATGPVCATSQTTSYDVVYMNNMMAQLAAEPTRYDLSRVFFHGCSQGSGMAFWQATCQHFGGVAAVSAFATSSTGLKTSTDGLAFPVSIRNNQVSGSCAGCSFPVPVVPAPGLKACIFNNVNDPGATDRMFYQSSLNLEAAWRALGNPTESHYYTTGGHCYVHSRAAIAQCMDDGRYRLITINAPDPPPPSCPDVPPPSTPQYTCAQQDSFGKCGQLWMAGYCCSTCYDCDTHCQNALCLDRPPPSTQGYDCADQWVRGKCNEPWMAGFCCHTCSECAESCTAIFNCGDGTCNGAERTTNCAQDCGAECGDEVCNGNETAASCPADACPVNCTGSWSQYTTCTTSCGAGTQSRTFTRTVPAQNGGQSCAQLYGLPSDEALQNNVCVY